MSENIIINSSDVPIAGNPVKPINLIGDEYRKSINKLILAMIKDIKKGLVFQYGVVEGDVDVVRTGAVEDRIVELDQHGRRHHRLCRAHAGSSTGQDREGFSKVFHGMYPGVMPGTKHRLCQACKLLIIKENINIFRLFPRRCSLFRQ